MNVAWGLIHSMDEAPPGIDTFEDGEFTRDEDTEEGRDHESYQDDWGQSVVSHNTFDHDIYRRKQGKKDVAYSSDSLRIFEWVTRSPR